MILAPGVFPQDSQQTAQFKSRSRATKSRTETESPSILVDFPSKAKQPQGIGGVKIIIHCFFKLRLTLGKSAFLLAVSACAQVSSFEASVPNYQRRAQPSQGCFGASICSTVKFNGFR